LQLSHTTEGKGVPVPPGASLLRQARRAASATAAGGLVVLALAAPLALALAAALASPARAASPDPSPAGAAPTPDPYPGSGSQARSTAGSHPAASVPVVSSRTGSAVAPTAAPARTVPAVRPGVSHRTRPAAGVRQSTKPSGARHRPTQRTHRRPSPLLPFTDLIAPAWAAASAAPALARRADPQAVSTALALAVAGVVLSSGLLLAGIAREVRR
jgi:hypothetical protein